MFCEQCQRFWQEAISKAEVPQSISRCEDVKWTYHETVLHRDVLELKHTSDLRCRLCRIIHSTPTDYEHETLLKDVDEPVDVVLSLDPNKGPHPVLSVEFCGPEAHGIKISKRLVASCSGILNEHHLATALTRAAELDNDSTGSDGALALATYWMKKCVAEHDQCRQIGSDDEASFVPTRLLDVSNGTIRLIESKDEFHDRSDRRFVALSHCWGLVPIIRTLIGNYDEHRQGIAPRLLSRTFQDAIHTTRKLGYRYIWIDSLCIKQDDSADWVAEAATMCDVYQYAALTIAAAHAPGGDVGCFAERDGLLRLPFHLELPTTAADQPPIRIQFTSYGRAKDMGGGDPALYGRAWVLQEQLLSPRMLIFDGEQMKWECLSMHGSESSPISGTTRHSLYHKHIRSGIMDDFEYFDHVDAKEEQYQDTRFWSLFKHQYWCYIVMDYTHRGMTKSSDRLVALAGVGKALSRHTKSRYLAGLWSEHFTTGLLWHIAHNEKFGMSAMTNFDIESNLKIRHEENVAPSWSWASVTAPVMYASNELLSYDRVCEIIDVSVSDGVAKQTGRAEIRGHVRRGFVNAVYPFSIREATTTYPHMTMEEPTGRLGREQMHFKGRVFHPNDYFLFSEEPPSTTKIGADWQRLTTQGAFRLVRGSFKPDEPMNPAQEMIFIAIAQQHFGVQLTTSLPSHNDEDALKVHSLALVPTGKAKNEYRRVGLAIWDECAWYGYLCGWKNSRDRIVEKPGRQTENGKYTEEGWWDRLGRKLWWDDLEMYEEQEHGSLEHGHAYEAGCVPELVRYHEDVSVEERIVIIV